MNEATYKKYQAERLNTDKLSTIDKSEKSLDDKIEINTYRQDELS